MYPEEFNRPLQRLGASAKRQPKRLGTVCALPLCLNAPRFGSFMVGQLECGPVWSLGLCVPPV